MVCANQRACYDSYMHRSSGSDSRQTQREVRVHGDHGRIGLGQQGLLLLAWILERSLGHDRLRWDDAHV